MARYSSSVEEERDSCIRVLVRPWMAGRDWQVVRRRLLFAIGNGLIIVLVMVVVLEWL